jgi:predicted nucleotidyltransferase
MVSITQKQHHTIESIARQYGIDLLVLFGSHATGRAHAKSDVDLAYQSHPPLSLRDEARLILDLSPVFKTEYIDIVNIAAAPPLLRYAIFKDGVPLFEGVESAFASYGAYAFKQYIEAKPLFVHQLNYLRAHP